MHRPYLVAVVLFLVAAAAAPAAQAERAERLLPDSTLVFISLDDMKASAERFADHPLKALGEVEEVVNFFGPLLEMAGEHIAGVEAELGVSPFGLFEHATGQVAVAFTGIRSADAGMRLGLVVTAEVGENAEAFSEWIAVLEKKLAEQDEAMRTEEEFRGVKLVVWTEKAADEEEEEEEIEFEEEMPFDVQLTWCLVDGLFLFGTDAEDVRLMLARRGEEQETGLSASADFQLVREKSGPADLFVYFNFAGALETLGSILEVTGAAPAEIVFGVIDTLGLTGLRAIGQSSLLTPSGTAARGYILLEPHRQGLLKLLEVENSGLMPPRFVPPDATSAATMKLNIGALWSDVRRMVGSIQPDAVEQLNAGLEQIKQNAGVDLEQDLIGSLGTTFTFYEYPTRIVEVPSPFDEEETFEMPVTRMVMALEATNPEKLRGALNMLIGLAGANMGMVLQSSEYMGVQVDAMEMGPGVSMGIALVGGNLVFASDLEDLKALIRLHSAEDAKSLVEAEAFARAMEGLPRSRMAVGYTDLGASIREMGEALAQFGGMFGGMLGMELNWEAFPVEALERCFDVSSFAMVLEEQGLLVVSSTLMRKPAKDE